MYLLGMVLRGRTELNVVLPWWEEGLCMGQGEYVRASCADWWRRSWERH